MQMLLILVPIFVFGLLIALCNRFFYANFGSRGKTVCYITGFIGTPVHELSHALMCLIFGHRIHEIKLFQVGAEDGTLGYVSHTYRKTNVYQSIGNFFIGIAPILVISALLYLIAWLLMPAMVAQMSGHIRGIGLSDGFGAALQNFFAAIGAFFAYAANWRWWVFLLVGMFLALHMTLSHADLKGAWSGLIVLLLLFFVVDVILGFAAPAFLHTFTAWLMTAAVA